MDQKPGTSKNSEPLMKKVKYDLDRHKHLTDEELLEILEESDIEDDLLVSESDDDSEFNPCSDSEEVLTLSPSPQGAPVVTTPQWSHHEIPQTDIPFTAVPGILVNVGVEPIDYFNLLATDEFYDFLCTKANAYALELLFKSGGDKSRISRWKDVDIGEMKTFFGLLFHMGTIRLNRIQDYWKTHYLFNISPFATFMSRNRFLLILRSIHFEDMENQPRTQMGKILPLVNFFNDRMQVLYYPDKELSIDESMVLWRGRLKFRQYIKGKRHKFGIKLYILSEPNGLAQKIIVYAGSADPQLSGSQHTEKVVLSLLQEKLGVGHSVYMDNFYNSVKLTKDLLDHKTYVTGTLRANRKGNPAEVVNKKLKKGQLVAQFNTDGICVIKWKDRREILAISSEFNGQMEEVTTQRGKVLMKPKLINEYNKFMAGIDHCDQMLSYYPCEHKTLIWYKKLAVHIFQAMLLNSFHLYKKGTGNRKSFYEFRLKVIEKLLGPPPSDSVPKVKLQHLPEYCPKGENGKTKRRRCSVCWNDDQKRKDSIFYCPQCPGGPGLCLTPCFRLYHANK